MPGSTVVTLTPNPAIDVSCDADEIRPTHKIRTSNERLAPGGGGINVARVIQRLGCPVDAIFMAGGPTGEVLDSLLARQGLPRKWIRIARDTRMSLAVHERSTGLEYRFVPEGPRVSARELEEWLAAISDARCAYLVASGSLPRGAADDLFARSAAARYHDSRLVLDTSGPALRSSLEAGGTFLVKPSRGELERLAGRPLPTLDEVMNEAKRLVASGRAEHVAVTLGADGALLVNKERAGFLPAIPLETRSAVGAGDSFLAGFVHGLATNLDVWEAFRLATAAGAAAVLSPGADLCRPEDVRRLLQKVPTPEFR